MCLFRIEAEDRFGRPFERSMSAALRWLVVVIIGALLAYTAWPWLKNAVFLAELLAEDLPSTLPVPVKGVSLRAVRDTFGAARPGDRMHQGVDIFAARGTPVVSATRGLVARIGENSLGGTVVWVLGPGGDRHYYAHLNSVADIKTGQRLLPGDLLGTVGTTGNARSTPPHLHYGIYRRGGGAINPFPLLIDTAITDAPRLPRKNANARAADRSAE